MNIAVILLTWQRVHNLSSTLSSLETQSYSGFDTYIWNNNILVSEAVDKAVSSSPLTIRAFHSNVNLGCIARHQLAYKLQDEYSHFIFIDDDQQFDINSLSTIISESRQGSLVGWWAWHVGSSYWIRHRAKPGQSVNYLGCGMTIIPSSFYKADFFDLPSRYLGLDDLWCSIYAQINGFDLLASGVNVVMNGDDDVALYGPLCELKSEFYDWSRETYAIPRINRWVDVKFKLRMALCSSCKPSKAGPPLN